MMPDPTPLTDADLEAIRERCERATVPPWRARKFEGISGLSIVEPEITFYDWQFCCAAREDIPALLAEVARLKAALKKATGMLEDAASWEDIGSVETQTQREIIDWLNSASGR
jgi:hypothetical protein